MKCEIYCGVTKNMKAVTVPGDRALRQLMEASSPVELKSGRLGGRMIKHDGQLFDRDTILYLCKNDLVILE